MSSSISTTSASNPHRDTGFNEPLNPDRNTTLPHPEAKPSNSEITASHIGEQKAKRRLSGEGNLDEMYDDIEYASVEKGDEEGKEEKKKDKAGGLLHMIEHKLGGHKHDA
ncbi:MAG: hypothetical protein M1824_004395 [Vezdaea acicularis]|nr:MAG: hypothetical protein M1824_004395 [Vezdaea acicularis]